MYLATHEGEPPTGDLHPHTHAHAGRTQSAPPHRGHVGVVAARSSHQIHHVLGWVDAWESNVAARIRVGVSGQKPLLRIALILVVLVFKPGGLFGRVAVHRV